MNNYDKLCNVLKTNPILATESGELLKNKVQELARKLDASLLTTLLSDPFTSEMFFTDVNGVKVFDANKFTYMVESQAFLPDSYTRFKQNIMLTDGLQSIRKSGNVVLEFPNKDCLLEFDSTDTDTSREEVFLNETLMKKEIDTLLDHKAFANATRYTVDGAKPATEVSTDDNLIIKGNNLLTLHTLYPKYKDKIKLMYWDILYNTKNDKVPYNDSFKHSSWLTMMKDRLIAAKKLLKDGGFIFVQCDKNEDAYLTVLMDEIFCDDSERSNHICTITVKSNSISGVKTAHKNKTILKNKDSILVYKKGNVEINPQYTVKKRWDTHYNSILIKNKNGEVKKVSLKDILIKNNIISSDETIDENALKNPDFEKFALENAESICQTVGSIRPDKKKESLEHVDKVISWEDSGEKYYAYNGRRISFLSKTIEEVNGKKCFVQLLGDLWTDIDFQNTQNEGGVDLPAGKKPEALIKRIIDMCTAEGDVVLDAYLGSGTTAAVAHKMGRRYIGIEQLDSHSEMEIKRMQGVINGDQTGISSIVNWSGGGSFVFFELAKNSHNILDKIVASTSNSELTEIYDELRRSPFVLYTVDIQKMEQSKKDFSLLTIEEQKKVLISIIDKNTLYVNYSDIDSSDCQLSEQDKIFTKSFYQED